MDATTRWETEAMRSGAGNRQSPPQPSRRRRSSGFVDNRNWVTLREAEAATGIPTNTLRKWVRKADLPSYLEADGDLALRMVDLDAVIVRAEELGRELAPQPEAIGEPSEMVAPRTEEAEETPDNVPEPPVPSTEPEAPPGTMIVPIDAWNKVLNQLGNLHEAGQQLADARERAAKAETETRFLRERLAEIRAEHQEPIPAVEPDPQPEPDSRSEPDPESVGSTTYWRYLTTGWRNRQKRNT